MDDPDAVLLLLHLIIDGLRMRALRDPDRTEFTAEWPAARAALSAFLAPHERAKRTEEKKRP
ncbi:hypothetical protein [Streptomyces sp. NBC_00690]|uniref:hypothetical protein n=1 Tax=Streptomyces sp. NBC_00690 TaxID=2975808 RepID=UPI002E28B61A|nr:hypothetical protein [Streptomyces sp. NBC_00690]